MIEQFNLCPDARVKARVHEARQFLEKRFGLPTALDFLLCGFRDQSGDLLEVVSKDMRTVMVTKMSDYLAGLIELSKTEEPPCSS